MLKKSFYFHKLTSKFFFPFGIIIILPVLFGCASNSNYGSLKGSRDITELFENNQILPDHTYYYSGFEAAPYAIIGIQNEYTLQAPGWTEIALTPDELNQKVFRMRTAWLPPPKGEWILGPNDERLGVWYCSQQWTAVRLEKDHIIFIATPQPSETKAIQIR
jgi:hypothetical protein